MKRSNLMFLTIGVAIIFIGCSKDDSLAPESIQSDQVATSLKGVKALPKLIGTMDLDFDLDAKWPEDAVWEGTISFEGYSDFGIRFFHLSPFRDFSQVSPFEEYFEIYDLEDETVVLAGPDIGRTILAKNPPEPCKYVMNGVIDVATGPFDMWLGRNVHMSGIITWQVLETPVGPVIAPETAPGTLRIN